MGAQLRDGANANVFAVPARNGTEISVPFRSSSKQNLSVPLRLVLNCSCAVPGPPMERNGTLASLLFGNYWILSFTGIINFGRIHTEKAKKIAKDQIQIIALSRILKPNLELMWSPVVVNLKGECKLRGFYLLHPEFYYSRTNLTRKPVPRGILERLL